MRYRYFYSCLLIFATLTVFPQNALLWKISDIAGNNSYIYGTIHLKDKRVYIYADTALNCMKTCDKLALELDMNPMNILKYSEMLFLKDDLTLRDIFDEEDYKIISANTEKSTGLNFTFFERLKPVALLSVVMQNLLAGDVDFTLDEFFYQKGTQVKMDVIGLETFDEQFMLLETIPVEYIIDFLKNPEKGISELEPIICNYQAAHIDELLKLMQDDETMVALSNDFLDERNIKMADKIDEILRNNTLFVAVGAGHLPGEKGIVSLLRQKGYSVSPVMLKTPAELECE